MRAAAWAVHASLSNDNATKLAFSWLSRVQGVEAPYLRDRFHDVFSRTRSIYANLMIHLYSNLYMAHRMRACTYHISIAKVENSRLSSRVPTRLRERKRIPTKAGDRLSTSMHVLCHCNVVGQLKNLREEIGFEICGPKWLRKRTFRKLAHEPERKSTKAGDRQ